MRPAVPTLDRYLFWQVVGTLTTIFGITVSLMLLEHLPRLFDIVRLSGRKGYIVVESMAALLPEYAGIGSLFGLYLAIALTVRKAAVRGELQVIEAVGISPWRLIRFPALVALAGAGFLLWNQGWLMPHGERRLAELGQQMEDGDFGFSFSPGQFVDLGGGTTLLFRTVDPAGGRIRSIFLETPDITFAASSGRLGFSRLGQIWVDLEDGMLIDPAKRQFMSFSKFHIDTADGERADKESRDSASRRKTDPLPKLLWSIDPRDRAAAYARLLWPSFALLIPLIALVMGRPPIRSSSVTGLFAGAVLVVAFIRSTGLLATAGAQRPELLAATIAVAWIGVTLLLAQGQMRWGAGYVDVLALRLLRRIAAYFNSDAPRTPRRGRHVMPL